MRGHRLLLSMRLTSTEAWARSLVALSLQARLEKEVNELATGRLDVDPVVHRHIQRAYRQASGLVATLQELEQLLT